MQLRGFKGMCMHAYDCSESDALMMLWCVQNINILTLGSPDGVGVFFPQVSPPQCFQPSCL